MKNNKRKRVLTAVLACVMLLGASVTVNAQSAGTAMADGHQHAYKVEKNYNNSYTLGTHQYLITTGAAEEYGTCYMVAYLYSSVKYTCTECGYSYTTGSGREVRHMQCGARTEEY